MESPCFLKVKIREIKTSRTSRTNMRDRLHLPFRRFIVRDVEIFGATFVR